MQVIQFFIQSVVKPLNRLLREMIESQFLEVFEKCVDVAIKDIVYCGTSAGLLLGPNDTRGLFQPR